MSRNYERIYKEFLMDGNGSAVLDACGKAATTLRMKVRHMTSDKIRFESLPAFAEKQYRYGGSVRRVFGNENQSTLKLGISVMTRGGTGKQTEVGREITRFADEVRTELRKAADESDESRKLAELDAQAPSTTVGPQVLIADELRKLAELRDSGVLTEAEFEAQKAKLLESD